MVRVASAVDLFERSSSPSTVLQWIMALASAQRWLHGDMPPQTLILSCGDVERLHVAQHHGRKGFVQFMQVDVARLHAQLAQQLAGDGSPVSMTICPEPTKRRPEFKRGFQASPALLRPFLVPISTSRCADDADELPGCGRGLTLATSG